MLPAHTNPAKTKALSTLRVVMAYAVCLRCTGPGVGYLCIMSKVFRPRHYYMNRRLEFVKGM